MTNFLSVIQNKRDIPVKNPFSLRIGLEQSERFSSHGIQNKRSRCSNDSKAQTAKLSCDYKCGFYNWLIAVVGCTVLQYCHERVSDCGYYHYRIKKSNCLILTEGDEAKKNWPINNESSNSKPNQKQIIRTISSFRSVQQCFLYQLFLRVLGWDFLLDFQILPSTAEASARGRRENDISRISVNYDSRLSIRSTKEEYSLDRLAVSGNDTVPGVLCDKRLCPSNNRGDIAIRFICLFLWFSATIFFTQISRMDRHRIYSIFSANAPSLRPCIHSLRSVRIRFRTLLLGLTFFIPHFSNSHRRKQSAKHRHCSAQEISHFGFFIPTNNQRDKAGRRPEHKFIDGINFHFLLRVLGWDFFRDSQILPSTAEVLARRIG